MDLKNLGLSGKTAIVTGASQGGIGHAIASALHAEGVALALVSQSRRSAQAAAQTISAEAGDAPVYPIVADLSLQAEVERVVVEAITRLGHVDILINSAARAKTGAFFDMSDSDLQEIWQVKGMGYVRMTRAITPHMKQRGAGRIVNINGAAARTPAPEYLMVSMVNAALVNFTRGISRDLARSHIRINSISPDVTLTERMRRHIEMQAAARRISFEAMLAIEAQSIPLGRLVTLDEIAALALYVVSDLCPSLTGEDIALDGGLTPGV